MGPGWWQHRFRGEREAGGSSVRNSLRAVALPDPEEDQTQNKQVGTIVTSELIHPDAGKGTTQGCMPVQMLFKSIWMSWQRGPTPTLPPGAWEQTLWKTAGQLSPKSNIVSAQNPATVPQDIYPNEEKIYPS